jgi:hypothetical protein
MNIQQYRTTGGKSMKFVPQVIAAKLLLIFSLVLGCQTITEMTRIESDKDAAISKAYGQSMRVHNPTAKDKGWRCTVCDDTKAGQPEKVTT